MTSPAAVRCSQNPVSMAPGSIMLSASNIISTAAHRRAECHVVVMADGERVNCCAPADHDLVHDDERRCETELARKLAIFYRDKQIGRASCRERVCQYV